MMRPWKQMNRIFDEQRVLREALSLRDLTPDWSARLSEAARSYESTQAWLKRTQFESTNWARLLSQLEEQRRIGTEALASIRVPEAVWQSSIASVTEAMHRVRFIESYPRLSATLLSPFNYYSDFSRRTITELERTRTPRRRGALSAALMLAEEHTIASADLLADAVDAVEGDDESGTDTPLIIFDVQYRELAREQSIDTVDEFDEILLLSPTAQLSRKARRIIQAIVSCNRSAKLIGKPEVFTPTTTFVEAQSELTWLAVRDRNSLGQLVDALYLMLYEAAGKDHLRFGEYLTDEECGVIWIIKHLRNKLLRHDPDHGTTSNQGKSWRDLRASLNALGFSTFPKRVGEFERLGSQLLDEVDQFLEKLASAIDASAVN